MISFQKYFDLIVGMTQILGLMTIISILIGCQDERGHHIIIESQPPGAKVFLDDQYIGVAPMSFQQLENEPRKIFLVLEGYYEYQMTMSLSNVHRFVLVPFEKNIEIEFTPIPDLLFVDGLPYPPGKKINLFLSLEEHRLFAYKQNYPFLAHRFQITSTSPSQLKMFFPSANTRNRLQLNSKFSEVEVYHREYFLGHTPLLFQNLSTDPISLTFRRKGFEDRNIFLRLNKGESRSFNISMIPFDESYKIFWENLPDSSQLVINDKVVLEKVSGEVKETTVSPSTNSYHYRISHPEYYILEGVIPSIQFSNAMAMVTLNPVGRIPSHPPKILETYLPIYDTGRAEGDYFFLSDYEGSKVHVFDLSFNLLNSFSLQEVGDHDNPFIMTGFQYPGLFLLPNRIIAYQSIFPTIVGRSGLINPVYLLPFSNTEEDLRVAVFDNGDHRIKFFDFQEKNLWKEVTAQDYYSIVDPINQVKRAYLLPLRFSQAIWLSPQFEEMVFIDVINRDIKTYHLSESPGYFLSEFEPQPSNPQSITSYHDFILVGDKNENKIWVYDQQGKYIHQITLSGRAPRYLWVRGKRLYALGEKVLIYALE